MIEFSVMLLSMIILIIFAYKKHKKDKTPSIFDKIHSSNNLNEIILLNEKIKFDLYDYYELASLEEFHQIYNQDIFNGSGKISPFYSFFTKKNLENYLYTISKDSNILSNEDKEYIKSLVVNKTSLDLIFIMYLNEVHSNNMAVRYIALHYIDKSKIQIA